MADGPRASSQKLGDEIRKLQEEVRALKLSLWKLNAQLGNVSQERSEYRQGQRPSVKDPENQP